MILKSGLLASLLLLTLGACALPPPERAERVPKVECVERAAPRAPQPQPQAESAAAGLLGELARVSALSAEQRRREFAELDGTRLDDARRFQLAALLERDDNIEALERSLKNLIAIGEVDSRSQSLLDLMKKSLRARIESRQLTARNAELQDKLEQIKALEKSLQQRNAPLKQP